MYGASGRATGTVSLTDGPGDPRADISLQGENLVVRGAAGTPIQRVRLTAAGPLSRMPFQLSIAAPQPQPITFDGSGVFSRTGTQMAVSLSGAGEAREIAYRTVEPVVVRIGPEGQSVRARLNVGGGQAFVEGRKVGEVEPDRQHALDLVEVDRLRQVQVGCGRA